MKKNYISFVDDIAHGIVGTSCSVSLNLLQPDSIQE